MSKIKLMHDSCANQDVDIVVNAANAQAEFTKSIGGID